MMQALLDAGFMAETAEGAIIMTKRGKKEAIRMSRAVKMPKHGWRDDTLMDLLVLGTEGFHG